MYYFANLAKDQNPATFLPETNLDRICKNDRFSAKAGAEIWYSPTNTISGVHVSPGSAETLARRDGITNHHLIASSLSNIPAKIAKITKIG